MEPADPAALGELDDADLTWVTGGANPGTPVVMPLERGAVLNYPNGAITVLPAPGHGVPTTYLPAWHYRSRNTRR